MLLWDRSDGGIKKINDSEYFVELLQPCKNDVLENDTSWAKMA